MPNDSQWFVTLSDGDTRMDGRLVDTLVGYLAASLKKPNERPFVDEFDRYLKGNQAELSADCAEHFYKGAPIYDACVQLLPLAAVRTSNGHIIAIKSPYEVISDDQNDHHVIDTVREAKLKNWVRKIIDDPESRNDRSR